MSDAIGNYFSGLVQNATSSQASGLVNKATDAVKMTGGDREKIRKAGDDFESVFLSQMIKPMFEGLQADPLFGGGSAEETWRGMMIDQYGKLISKAGGVGVSKYVQDTLIKIQEGSV
ncbi:MAG: hypothetical protein EB060_08745 [Proteobacteria bacterium]|nr:hypothetical protein [Pseudomonadota bacterium]